MSDSGYANMLPYWQIDANWTDRHPVWMILATHSVFANCFLLPAPFNTTDRNKRLACPGHLWAYVALLFQLDGATPFSQPFEKNKKQ